LESQPFSVSDGNLTLLVGVLLELLAEGETSWGAAIIQSVIIQARIIQS
jgi:hypothetical protein